MNENKSQTVPGVLKKLAQILETRIENRTLQIPEKYGTGFCTGYVFDAHIRMLISNYELNEDVDVENPDMDASKRMIFFKFQNIFPKTEAIKQNKSHEAFPSVLIATSRINTDEVISIHSNAATITIEVDANYLQMLFNESGKTAVLESLLQNTQPLLFEQLIYPSLQKIVDEIINEHVHETFELVYRRIKAEELVCRLLMELDKRDEKRLYALNARDIQAIYQLKEEMLKKLDVPPSLEELAEKANMSSSKLKRLFKQIFGNSLFRYYQEFRMKEAARLLKEEKLAVSEVGYRLGFTNLSHFARVFHQHFGMKPKQYSRS